MSEQRRQQWADPAYRARQLSVRVDVQRKDRALAMWLAGEKAEVIASVLGYKTARSVMQAVKRARRQGDQRGVYHRLGAQPQVVNRGRG